ncbi:MAG: hypothetical protein M3362_23930 [Acidobacteriota bacterium]|nr:hypothetical protein [Acidobacteriota bacterium]
MLSHRKLVRLFSMLLIVLMTAICVAQENKEHQTNLLLLGIQTYTDGTADLWFVFRDPQTKVEYAYAAYSVRDSSKTPIPVKVGETYVARLSSKNEPTSIIIKGSEFDVGPGRFPCDVKEGHWEWSSASYTFPLVCKPGPRKKSTQKNNNIPPCDVQQRFHDTTLTVVITVKPASGLEWTFPEAASNVAQRILADLNDNKQNITFKEASGVAPNLYINVTVSETSEGTKQDSATAEVTRLGKPYTLFTASSGEAPFVGLREAIDHLSTNMLRWLEGGWHRPATCVTENGSVLNE